MRALLLAALITSSLCAQLPAPNESVGAGGGGSGSMVYPVAGIPVSVSGTSWRGTAAASGDLSDYSVVRTSPTILTISAGRARFENVAFINASGSATISAGTGTAYIYIANGGQPTVANGLTVTCGGGFSCTALPATVPPVDSIPIATWTATNGTWDVVGYTDYRAFISSIGIAAGANITVSHGSGSATITATIAHGIGYAFDGGGSALTTGNSPVITVPFACTLNAWNATVDTGTITFEVWKKATGTAVPTISDVINTSGVGISVNTAIHSTTLTDFTTTAVAANDMVIIAITAVASATKASLVLGCQQ